MALEEILRWKRRQVEERPGGASPEPILDRCAPSRRSLSQALMQGAPGFILELKHASPSAGRLADRFRRSEILSAYAPHADAVSVVTDTRFFGGSLDDLALASRLTDLPVLCKDFIVDPVQVAEARLHGADAVLLILAALDDAAWRACSAMATRLDMDVLTEVHDEVEARRAVDLGALLIGINNRDLGTLRVDRGTVARLSPLIPEDRVVVAESGIRSREDVRAMRCHADAFLVGTSLLQAPDLEARIRRLVYGLTKICGLTSREEAEAAWRAGATHGGLVFAGPSPRQLAPEQAAPVRRAAPLRWVGIFVNEDPERIAASVRSLDLHAVQLHGDEGRREIAGLRSRLPGRCEIWKAVRVREGIFGAPGREDGLEAGSTGDGALAVSWAPRPGADRILLDTWSPGRPGGTGRRFDWSVLQGLPFRRQAVLSGGLGPDNAAEAAATGVAGLDVSSGVERTPGRKDPVLIRSFLEARRRLPGRRGGAA